MVKNLTQLKKALKDGAPYVVVKHYVHPKYDGQVRKASYVGSAVMYSKSVVPDDINTLNNGYGIKTDFHKAADWAFSDGVCVLHDSRRDRDVMEIKVLTDRTDVLEAMLNTANTLCKCWTRSGEDALWRMSSDWNSAHDESEEIAMYEYWDGDKQIGFQIEDFPYYYEQMTGYDG